MSSITMCDKFRCPKAARCYRYRKKPEDVQTYGTFPGWTEERGCVGFEIIPANSSIDHKLKPEFIWSRIKTVREPEYA